MGVAYQPLPSRRMAPGTRYHRLFRAVVAPPAKLSSPATDVMTDLRKVPAVTIDADEGIEEANSKMLVNRIRLLLVVDEGDRILGVITATDILGEKPVRHLQRTRGRRSEILVRDIMTAEQELEVMDLHQVQRAHAGHIVAHLQQVGRQHALVVERDGNGHDEVVGLFSTSQIGRQLGAPVATTAVARTFAEREAELMAGEREAQI